MSDSDFFINSVTFIPGSSWDCNINLTIQDGSGFVYSGQTNGSFENRFYNFGTLIDGTVGWQFDAARHSGAVASSVTLGLYDFSIEVFGGPTNTAMNTLASYDYQFEVVDMIDISVTGQANPESISSEETSTLSMTVDNHMTSRDFVSTIIYYLGEGMTMGADSLEFQEWGFSWIGQHVAPGTSWTAP